MNGNQSSCAMRLAQFPDEVWDQIFDFLYADSVVRLWNTGDKAIVRRMKLCTSLEVQLEPRREISWPRNFLSSLPRLRKLIFGQSQSSWKPFVNGVDLSVLPRDLRTLELNYANGLICLLGAAPVAPDPNIHFTDTRNNLQFIDLHAYFPKLERLSYVNDYWDQTMNYGAREFISLVSSMPLTHLLLDASSKVTMDDLPSLPATLLWLDVDFTHLGEWEETAPHFPPHLTYLRFQGCSTTEYYGLLPPKLRTLIHEFEFGTFTDEGIAQLPQTLTKYAVTTLGHFSSKMASSLPQSLKCLHLRVLGVDYELEKHLPRSLEELSIHGTIGEEEPVPISSVDSFPRSLTSLILHDNITPSPDQWKYLPRSLTCLESHLMPGKIKEFLALPPQLKRLKIDCRNEFPSTITIGHRFKSLTEITITEAVGNTGSPISLSASFFEFVSALPLVSRLKILCRFDLSHLDILKHSLTSLKMKFADWHELNLRAPWAAQLETLVFSNVVDPHPSLDDAGWISTAKGTGLPPPKSSSCRGFSASSQPMDQESLDQHVIGWFKLLPSTLTQLQPGCTKERSSFALPGNVLRFLPPKLKILKIRLETFPAGVTQYLPQSLTKLITYVKKATPLSAEDYHQLPLVIRQLRIPAPDVNDPQTLMPWVAQRPMLTSLFFHILSGARFGPISTAIHSGKRGLSLQQLFQESTGNPP